jgi:hypothetical protein
MKKILFTFTVILFTLTTSLPLKSFAQDSSQNTDGSSYGSFKKGDLSLGAYIAFGYNVLSHVDGTLAVIPNHTDPHPSPGSPVTSSGTSVNLEIPTFAIEYWVLDKLSVRNELGVNIIIAGAVHPISDFAYIFLYTKLLSGVRYYPNGTFFLGTGLFVNFPLTNPLIGFISSETGGLINFGPYIETGINYPVNKHMSLEASFRFSFAALSYSKKSDPDMLATVRVSPFDIGLGFNYIL